MQRISIQLGVSLALTAALTAIVSTTAHANDDQAPSFDARTDRIQGLDKDDLASLDGLLANGPFALVEFANTEADQLPAINVAVLVHAPARTVESIVTNPAQYPSFMPAIDDVDIVERRGQVIVYDWSFDLALLQMSGRNVMTVYSAPKDRPDATTRVTIDSENGDLGRGRFLFRLVPRTADSSVLVLSMRLDLRKANYVARQLAKAARSMNRSANLSIAVSMAMHLQKQAELKSGKRAQAASATAAALVKPTVDVKALLPLLARGDLLSFHTQGDKLDQISVIGVIEQKQKKVHAAMRDANAFGSALVPGSAAKIVSEEAGVTTFDWNIDLPLVGLSGRMRMSDDAKLVSIDATEGAMRGGRWRFDLAPLGKRVTLVTGWASFDFKDTTWLLEKMIDADPFLGHGLSAASEVMLVRALRTRSIER